MAVENKNNPVFAQHECQILDLATNQKRLTFTNLTFFFLSIFFKKKDTRILLKYVYIKSFF